MYLLGSFSTGEIKTKKEILEAAGVTGVAIREIQGFDK
jgi:hypothetical protein